MAGKNQAGFNGEMRNRLLITLALGVLGAVLVAGVVSAQVNLGTGDVSVDVPDVNLPVCSNGKDDDGDGLVDLADPGCAGNPTGSSEVDPPSSSGGGGSTTTPTAPTTETAPTTPTTPTDPTTTPTEPTAPGGGGGGGSSKEGGPGNLPGGGPYDKEETFKGKKGSGKKSKGKGKSQSRKDKAQAKVEDRRPEGPPPIRKPDGSPSNSNPTVSIAPSGAAPIGVPNVVIDQFSIPPFLLPIYQACGTEYGIPWQILASINRIETAFGTNLNVSSAGALGWMQFMPATWQAYGVDANKDGRKDPYNPVDAICAAARYLNASGGADDLRSAIFAYNRADWYVDEVLLYARQYGKLPSGLVDSLTGLTEGAHFPVAAKSRYADDISEREAMRRSAPRQGNTGNAAQVISDSPTRRGINIFSKDGAPVVAVNDGVIKKIGRSKRLGRFVVLEDNYGNRFTYARLGELAEAIPVPKERDLDKGDFKLVAPGKDPKPMGRREMGAAKAEDEPRKGKGGNGKGQAKGAKKGRGNGGESARRSGPIDTEDLRARLFALPERPANRRHADLTGQLDAMLGNGLPGYETFKSYFSSVLKFDEKTMTTAPLRKGSRVAAGTVLGEIGETEPGVAPHVNFAIEPAGRGSNKIDPKPILDGWKLLEATAIYRAAGKNPFADSNASVGQILLMSKPQLIRRVLNDRRLEIYACGREDIQSGQIDRRVLASLLYLAERGFRSTVTSLKCGRVSSLTSTGNVSHHSTGHAVDIARLNGIPILGNQGSGSITEAAVKELLKLQGSMEPAQIITLMEMGGPTYAMSDHHDHIHLGFNPGSTTPGGKNDLGNPYSDLLSGKQWDKLLDRIGQLDQPKVPTKPSKYALPSKQKRASSAHVGE
jgi:hypothetical protein